jgi:hypothetical protein
MNRRVRVGVVAVGVCMSSVATAGCARREMGYRNTAPIRTEPPITTATTAVAAVAAAPGVDSDGSSWVDSTSAPSSVSTVVLTEGMSAPAAELLSAEVATPTKPAPGAGGFVPAPVADDYRIPIIMKVVAKSPLEQEVLDASSDLFVKLRVLQLQISTNRTELATVLRNPELDKSLKLHRSLAKQKAIPGLTERIVIESVTKVRPNSVIVKSCLVDSATLFEQSKSGTWRDPGNQVVTVIMQHQVIRTAVGWRISKETVLAYSKGDSCASL